MNILEEKLAKLETVFDTNKVRSVPLNKEYIAKYYKVNQLAYSFLHTLNDHIYMGVSRDGVYKPEDLLEAARTVEEFIFKVGATNVLELASGRGANSAYLAKRFPNVVFNGIDISEGQLYFAKKKAKLYGNYLPTYGDYHDLKDYKDNSIDICFIVEALCYSTEKSKVLSEVKRVLKKGGLFIIFDGYLHKPEVELTENEKLAAKLTEIGMAVEKFEEYATFRDTIISQKWNIIKEEDVSSYVLPTMRRFESLASKFLHFPRLARLLSSLLPSEFIYNVIPGYLMPTLIEQGVADYMITIVQK